MFHVIVDLPNASDHISGVKFKTHRNPSGVKHRSVITAEPVEAEIAARFKSIPGFSIVDADAEIPDPNTAPKRGRGRPRLDGTGTATGPEPDDIAP